MKWWRSGGVGAAFLTASLCLSACSYWNKVLPSKGGEQEQAAVKEKAPASSKEKAPASASPAATKTDKAEEKAKELPEKKPLSESQKEWEEKIQRSPWTVSGEYFRQREPTGTFEFDLGLGRLFGKSKETDQKQKSLEERIAKLEAERAAGASPAAAPAAGAPPPRARVVMTNGHGPANRLAQVVLEPETPNPKAMGRIPMEIIQTALAKEPRLILVEQPLVDRALQDNRLRPIAANVEQITTLLERELGAQLVVFLDEAAVSSDWDKRGQVQAQVVLNGEIREGVTGHVLSLLSAKGTQSASGSQEALAKVEALKQASDQMSTAILKKSLEYEWSARVLSVEDGRIRLNAGRRSGLQEGDLLRVFKSGGQEVYHPKTKLFVGLDLGDPKGKVRVTDFFGTDAAIARIAEGSGFAPNDLVKLEKQ